MTTHTDHAPTAPLQHWRGRIDRIDQELVRLWNQRAELALTVAEWKKSAGLPALDVRRERAIVRRAQRLNPGPLDETAIAVLFERMLAEIKRSGRRRRPECK